MTTLRSRTYSRSVCRSSCTTLWRLSSANLCDSERRKAGVGGAAPRLRGRASTGDSPRSSTGSTGTADCGSCGGARFGITRRTSDGPSASLPGTELLRAAIILDTRCARGAGRETAEAGGASTVGSAGDGDGDGDGDTLGDGLGATGDDGVVLAASGDVAGDGGSARVGVAGRGGRSTDDDDAARGGGITRGDTAARGEEDDDDSGAEAVGGDEATAAGLGDGGSLRLARADAGTATFLAVGLCCGTEGARARAAIGRVSVAARSQRRERCVAEGCCGGRRRCVVHRHGRSTVEWSVRGRGKCARASGRASAGSSRYCVCER